MIRTVLRTEHVTMQFGGVIAVNDLNIVVKEHEIIALIGPNGAGKTTAFNDITGVYTPTKGRVIYTKTNGQEIDITGKKPSEIAQLGIARTFQNIRLFKDLSVYENVLIAKHLHLKSNFVSATLRLPGYKKEEEAMRADVERLLKEVKLWDVRNEKASSLPYGKQRYLEIVRALATEPQLLLLDEPAAGMNPKETAELTDFIRQIRDRFKLTIFMIEHHMDLVMEISDRIYVLDFGTTIATGDPAAIQNNDKVRDLVVAYGGIEALKGISIDVPEGQIVTLIGANGAGKSTLLRTIMGLEKPRSGSVEYNEENLKGLNSQHIVTRGITLVPEGRRVFPNLTVLENLRIGAYLRKDEDGILKDIQRIYELALMCRPKLIMMDEPSLGLAPLVIKEIFNIIRRINESGTTVLLVEQNANMALKVAHHAYVLETGRIKMEGSGRELLENEEIKEAYLGKKKK